MIRFQVYISKTARNNIINFYIIIKYALHAFSGSYLSHKEEFKIEIGFLFSCFVLYQKKLLIFLQRILTTSGELLLFILKIPQ
jgi:hypothetical protein